MIQVRGTELRAGMCVKVLSGCMGWLIAGFATASLAGVNEITSLGFYGGDVRRVAFHPTNSSILYAAAEGGFYRSTNGGVSWQLVNERLRSPGNFAVHASRPNQLYLPSQGVGILVSDDAGATLSRLALADVYIGGIIEYSADGNVLYVTRGTQLYRSPDAGVSWSLGAEAPVAFISALAVDPTDANRLYIAGGGTEGAQSADGGQTWQPWNRPNTSMSELEIANTQPIRLWAATNDGVQFSDDRGLTWNTTATSPSLTITIDPHDATRIYSGTMVGVQRSIDNGANWNFVLDFEPPRVSSVAVDPADANHLVATNPAGVSISNDGGATWTRRNEGIDGLRIVRLLSSPASDRIYVSTATEGVLALSGDDRTLTPLDNATLRTFTGSLTSLPAMTLHPGVPDVLVGEVISYVFRSDTGGASWSSYLYPDFIGNQPRAFAFASADASRVLAATYSGLYRSVNGGADWEQVNSIVSEVGILASAPSNPRVVYWPARPAGASTDALMKSLDAGETWTAHAFPTPQILALAIDPRDERTVYASGSDQLLYKSTNGGESWSALTIFANEFFPIWDLAIDPQNPNIVYAGGGSRVARSVDAGATWQEVTRDAPPNWDVRALVVDAQRPHRLYVGLYSHGLREISIQPDLELTGGAPATPTGYGTAVPYSYRMRNIGPFDATNVSTRVQLPADATNISASGAGLTCNVVGTVVTCTAPILRSGAVADIRIDATQPAITGFTVAATLEGDQPDSVAANNNVISNVRIAEVTDISVRVGAPAQVTRGDALVYTITVANAGPNSATSPTVAFQLASGLNISNVTPSAGTCTTAGNNVTCQLPTLTATGSVTIQITSTASSSTGSFSSTASVTSAGVDLVATNDSVTSITSVTDPSRGGGGGGGGSVSLSLLAALALLARLRHGGIAAAMSASKRYGLIKICRSSTTP